GGALSASSARLRTCFEEQPTDLNPAITRSVVEWRAALSVGSIRIDPSSEECFDDFRVISDHGTVKRVSTVCARKSGLGFIPKKFFHYIQMPVPGCIVQSGFSEMVCGVNSRTVSQDHFGNRKMAQFGSIVEGCRAPLIQRGQIRPAVQKELNDFGTAFSRCPVQGGISGDGPSINVRMRVQEGGGDL